MWIRLARFFLSLKDPVHDPGVWGAFVSIGLGGAVAGVMAVW